MGLIIGESGLREAIPVLRRDYQTKPTPNESSYVFFPGRKIPKFYEWTVDHAGILSTLARLEKDNQELIKELHAILIDKQWRMTEGVGSMGAELRDPRAIAAIGLGRLGDSAAWTLPSLRKALHDDPKYPTEVAKSAAWAIARLDRTDRECLKVLKQVPIEHDFLESPFNGESPETVKEILGDRIDEVLPQIIRSVNTDNRFAMDLLIAIGPEAIQKSVDDRYRQMEEQGYFDIVPRIEELEDLGADGSPAVQLLVESLKSAKHPIRASAAYHLGIIGPAAAEAIPHLKIALDDDRVIVRITAATALGRIGPAASVVKDDLQRLSESDAYDSVRVAASKAIARIQK